MPLRNEKLLIHKAPPPAGTKLVTAPWDGQELATVETGGLAHVEAALEAAHRLYLDRDNWLLLDERVAILERTAALMAAHKDSLIRETTAEGGKPLQDTEVEVVRAIDGIRICIETIRTEQGEVVPMGGTAASRNRVAFTRREAIGVVVAVSAFNHPLNLIVHQVAAAVAAGCPVIVKPADDTPLACIRFVRLLHEAGLPPGWCQVLIASDLQVAESLVTDKRVAFFSFIGSAKVGWMLRSKLAPGTRCALEHGGAAPLLIAADADLTRAVPAVAKGGFYHAGQVCVSVQRVFAHGSVARQFAEQLAQIAVKLKVGDPLVAQTEVGPLIRPAELQRVDEWVQEAVAAGAQKLCGGHLVGETCYAPTVLVNPPEHVRVSQQEIFGPVVCVYSYDDIDEAIVRANSLPYAFQAAIFTADIDTALHAFSRLDASAVMVNDHTAFRVDAMPFAGLRESGLGIGGIPHTIREMSIQKLLVVQSSGIN